MKPQNTSRLRLLPAVDRILQRADVTALCEQHGRAAVTHWLRAILQDLRSGGGSELPDEIGAIEQIVVGRLAEIAASASTQRLREVINGTGIVIHTNLGRSPLAQAAIDSVQAAARCTNLEVDLSSGQRAKRGAAVELLCQEITGAEAALVVNNCAAATLLTLQTLAAGRRVIISRGQLIEIGGSFRLPDVFRQAGVELCEVGTTNRTRIADYAAAIDANSAALLRVHPSNFRVSGFCESVAIAELVELGRKHLLPVVDDVGSGCLYDLSKYGLPEEPIVGNSVRAGADLVIFSGDKLLGGPQCGVIVGREDIVSRLRRNPLARALRVDKLILAALQSTLEIHRAGRAFQEIPVLRQLTLAESEIRDRANVLLGRLQRRKLTGMTLSVESVSSAPGGGTLPGQSVPSWAIAIACARADYITRRLRLGTPAVFARVQDGRVLLDLRTVPPEDDERLVGRLMECLSD